MGFGGALGAPACKKTNTIRLIFGTDNVTCQTGVTNNTNVAVHSHVPGPTPSLQIHLQVAKPSLMLLVTLVPLCADDYSNYPPLSV